MATTTSGMSGVSTTQLITQPRWAVSTRKIHIRNVLITAAVLLVVAGFILFGLLWPVCNSTQVHGFLSCQCRPNSILDKQTGFCVCASNGTQSAFDCQNDKDERFVFLGQPINDKTTWTFTNATPTGSTNTTE